MCSDCLTALEIDLVCSSRQINRHECLRLTSNFTCGDRYFERRCSPSEFD
ncbi:MAG: hypothetical protein HC935_11365 [Pseudanabaena sp. SU_2_4]|nr:hypothetical protein [Pseudanabaena sp. SU_2_4]